MEQGGINEEFGRKKSPALEITIKRDDFIPICLRALPAMLLLTGSTPEFRGSSCSRAGVGSFSFCGIRALVGPGSVGSEHRAVVCAGLGEGRSA